MKNPVKNLVGRITSRRRKDVAAGDKPQTPTGASQRTLPQPQPKQPGTQANHSQQPASAQAHHHQPAPSAGQNYLQQLPPESLKTSFSSNRARRASESQAGPYAPPILTTTARHRRASDANTAPPPQRTHPASWHAANPFEEPKTAHYILGEKFVVKQKYQLVKHILGTGSYGIVIAAIDLETGEHVAIKKISKAFDHLGDARRILREIRLMRHIDHENVLRILDVDIENDCEIYITTPYMRTDLSKIMEASLRTGTRLLEEQIAFITYQVIRALKYLHSANIIHRDLKPENILVTDDCDIKICDFGLARFLGPEEQAFATRYVCTRFYRAPEVLLGSQYSSAMDMWSVGCILAEMYTNDPIFASDGAVSQLRLIFKALGKPAEEDTLFIDDPKARKFVQCEQVPEVIPLRKMIPQASPLAMDLVERLLIFNPDKRLTAVQALEHPYLAMFHEPDDEPVAAPELMFADLDPLNKENFDKSEVLNHLKYEANSFAYGDYGAHANAHAAMDISDDGFVQPE